ncbi:hypothetical protein QQP08_001702 [Theobroma cacao]|nr:hypothetical protein QQP08_001702 [Theobroma cacao]
MSISRCKFSELSSEARSNVQFGFSFLFFVSFGETVFQSKESVFVVDIFIFLLTIAASKFLDFVGLRAPGMEGNILIGIEF